jgi:error-prone DNA polymerase
MFNGRSDDILVTADALFVPLFQEQILRMAMTVVNFTGAEAEELRFDLEAKTVAT